MNRTSVVLSVVLAFAAVSASAGVEQAPPNFPYRAGVDAVYVDFENARYSIVYDVSKKSATVESEIVFDMPKDGFPIFDLVPEPTKVSLDGKAVEQEQISDPDGASKFRVLKVETSRGRHTLRISHVVTKNVSFKSNAVAAAFWTSDLSDRQYLEQYLPASFEYDAVAMTLSVEVVGADDVSHTIRANGEVRTEGKNRFTVVFPEYYTASSVFFHLTPETAFPARAFTYRSVDGRNIPVEIYSSYDLGSFEAEAKKVLAELESDYGPFPHSKVVVYGTGPMTGGMEYSGATASSVWALGHEFFHSYNARSVMPANGNAGWMDEAISSWRDDGYRLLKSPGFSSTKMAGHSKWTRMTDDDAYTKGAAFLAWIANRMSEKNSSLKTFLREYFDRHAGSTVTTEIFRDELAEYAKFDLVADFDTYIYGKSSSTDAPSTSAWPACDLPKGTTSEDRHENPFHPRLSAEQLERLLWP